MNNSNLSAATCSAVRGIEVAADIETSSEGYARRFAGPVGAWMLAVQERLVAEALAPLEPGATVLDVGGGHGQLLPLYRRRGFTPTVAGSDARCALRIAPAVAAREITFIESELTKLPFPDQTFDAVVSVRLLSHSPAWQHQARELCRVARSVVVVDYPVQSSVNALAPSLFALKRRVEGNTRNYLLFDDKSVADCFAEANFKRLYRRGQFALPMALHRMLKAPALSRGLEAACGVVPMIDRLRSPVIAGFGRG